MKNTLDPHQSHRYVARVTIEFITPFLVGTGGGGDVADAVFVTDANGLPALPGSSLAGVLRSAFADSMADAAEQNGRQVNELFGFQAGKQGQGSRLIISWACIHDAQDRPVEGLAPPDRLRDPVLTKALCPAIRDHVRINHKGVSDADERGKFDEQAICAGHRFTFELELHGTENDKDSWELLLRLLTDPALRLGGKTRRGFGAFHVVRIQQKAFDLTQDIDAYARHPVRLAQASTVLDQWDAPSRDEDGALRVQLKLTPKNYWMFGGGADVPGAEGNADMAPVRDARIIWGNGRATVQEDVLVVPATGIKGALAHRTAFHFNAMSGNFAGRCSPEDVVGENNPAVRQIFGYCKDSDDSGQRGLVVMNDIYLHDEPGSQLLHHVGIDRFTGGARDKVLFNERPLWQGGALTIDLYILHPETLKDATVKKAFAMALNDLAQGRLQVGAGHGRGLGFFKGTVAWPENVDWSAPAAHEVKS